MSDCLPGKPVSQGRWKTVGSNHVLVPMADGKVLDWVPLNGSWRLWNYDPNDVQDCLPGKPVSQGKWKTVSSNAVLVPMADGKVLEWVPLYGFWRLWNYDPNDVQDCLPGKPVSKGKWKTVGLNNVLVPMADGKVLDWMPLLRLWRLWNYNPNDVQDCLPGKPVSNGEWKTVGLTDVLVPMVDGKVLDWMPLFGSWRLWNYDPNDVQDCLPGNPVSQGTWKTVGSNHILVPMADGKVLDWVPSDGSWRLWNYQP